MVLPHKNDPSPVDCSLVPAMSLSQCLGVDPVLFYGWWTLDPLPSGMSRYVKTPKGCNIKGGSHSAVINIAIFIGSYMGSCERNFKS
jgi:predicted MFS family arabinose efflux permease